MKSVAYVTTTFPTLAAFIENEVHRLVSRGVDVRVFTLRGVGVQFQPEHAALVARTRPVGNPASPEAWLALVSWLARRPGVLLRETARILWASRGSGYAMIGHLGYLPAAALVASRVEREGLDRVHGAWAHFPGTVAYLAARLTGRPFSLAAHAGADLFRTQAFLAEKVRAADFTSACVRGNADMLRRLAGGAARVEWIYHGVDLKRFDGTGSVPDDDPLLLAVGRLSPPKGFDVLIRALGVLSRRGGAPRLALVGDGPEAQALAELARAEGVSDRVQFLGALTHDRLLPLYRRAWALVAPSVVLSNGRRDGIPNVVIEAMAMGVPCVGSRAAGLEEVILEGETGWLADPGDPESLATAIDRARSDRAARDRAGERARAWVRRDFDADRNFDRLCALFGGAGAVADAGVERTA